MSEQPIDETSVKAAFWTSETVNARLRDTFGERTGAAALLLAGLAPAPDCPEEADETACRLMLAAIKISDGNLEKLRLWVEAGRMDPRDLIAAAEYAHELQSGDEESRERDLAEYLTWVSRD